MNFKKIISFVLLFAAAFCLSKYFFMSYAAENSGYVVLLNDENASISFAGMKYAVESSLKSVSVEFQITDTNAFKGRQGVVLTVACGDRKDTAIINSDSVTDFDLSFFSLNNVFTEINSFDSHTNVKINFKLNFDAKLKDKLVFKMLFTDAVGVQSDEVYCVLYSPDETTEKPTKPVVSTTHILTECPNNIKQTSEIDFTEHYQKYPNYGNHYYIKDSMFTVSQKASENSSADICTSAGTEIHEDQRGSFGVRQAAALVLSAFLIIAAVVCITIGIKRNKVL